MPTTEIPTIVQKPILDALGLTETASRDEVLAAATALEGKPTGGLTKGEMSQLDALRKALGVKSGATRDDVVAALRAKIPTPIATQNALSQFALSIGLAADAPRTAILEKARAITAKGQVESAIAERRLHRAQRKTMLDLATRDFASFEMAMTAFTETIGYPTAEGELIALVEQRIGTGKSELTFAAALEQASRDHPELAAEVAAERTPDLQRQQLKFVAGEALAFLVTRSMSEGKTFEQAIELAAKQQPELVNARAN